MSGGLMSGGLKSNDQEIDTMIDGSNRSRKVGTVQRQQQHEAEFWGLSLMK